MNAMADYANANPPYGLKAQAQKAEMDRLSLAPTTWERKCCGGHGETISQKTLSA
jgi:hypothetical protein